MKRGILVGMLAMAGWMMVGCSTVTPYNLQLAEQSAQFGKITPADAVQILKTKMWVSGEIADYRTFIFDEEGFSYQKTTEETETEWKKGKPVETKHTLTMTYNVPWSAITEIMPYREEYKIGIFGEAFRARLDYSMTTVKYGARTKETEHVELTCKTQEDLADVVAALRALTGN